MGVLNETGAVVGIITDVTDDFSVVMSLLHKDSKISGKLLKTGETGTVSWDGEVPNIVQFSGIPKSVKMRKGDTIVTSGFSTTFPRGMVLGTIESAATVSGSGYLKIRVRTAADFNQIQFGYVIENFHAAAINQLLDKALKQP
jgi:rod shape-determining protein MreC